MQLSTHTQSSGYVTLDNVHCTLFPPSYRLHLSTPIDKNHLTGDWFRMAIWTSIRQIIYWPPGLPQGQNIYISIHIPRDPTHFFQEEQQCTMRWITVILKVTGSLIKFEIYSCSKPQNSITCAPSPKSQDRSTGVLRIKTCCLRWLRPFE